MTFQNVEPKIGRLSSYYVNTFEGRYCYTKDENELFFVRTETDYIPKHLLKLDLNRVIKIRREDTFKGSTHS